MGTYGILDARSNGAVVMVFVVATVAMSFTGWSYARMSQAVPRAGSVSAYAQAGLGRTAGFFAGWMISLDYLFVPSLAALFTGIAAHALLPSIPTWIFTIAGIILITGLNLGGVKLAATVGMVMLALEILVLATFVVGAVIVLIENGPQRGWLSPIIGYHGFHIAGIISAASVAILAYLGFDAVANFAEETTGSTRIIGYALIFCLILAGFLFALQSYFGGLLIQVTPAHLSANPAEQETAFYTMVGRSIGSWLGTPLTILRAIEPVFSALVAQAAVSRLMYGMASDQQLPAALARISSKTRTPSTAILVSAIATVIIAVPAAIRPNGLDLLSSMVTVGALTAFVFLHAAVIGYYVAKRRTAAVFRHIVIPVIGVAIIIGVLALASRLALLVAAGWLVIGAVGFLIRRHSNPHPPKN
jgi:amino acid transporter